MKKITLGSTSVHKLSAVRLACEAVGLTADVTGVKTESGQNEQPVGPDETYAGAYERALSVKLSHPDAIAIGIESGIIRFGEVTLDIAVIVVLTNDGRRIVTTSSGIQFPDACVRVAEQRGFENATVGSVVTETYGGDPTDPHEVLTEGKTTRTDTLVDAIEIVLRQI